MTPAICTRDRAGHVIACLQALLDSPDETPRSVLVIDSASSPDQSQLLAAFAAEHRQVELLRLESPGLSRARNLALQHVSTPWIAYLDDDARPAADWFRLASEACAAAPPDVGMIGGRIDPIWPGARPPGMGRRWIMFLSCIEDAEQDARGDSPDCFGANMLARRESLVRCAGFPEELGRIGDKLLSGEETFVQERLRQLGMKVVYRGDVKVGHVIEPERLTRRWVRERAFWGGVTEVVASRLLSTSPRHLRLRKVIPATGVLPLLSLWGDPDYDRSIRSSYDAGIAWAQLNERAPAAASLLLRAHQAGARAFSGRPAAQASRVLQELDRPLT